MAQKMYYYTSTETMQKILQNGNIWATNLAYMNDAREVKNGLSEIKELLCDVPRVKKWLDKGGASITGEKYEKLNPGDILTLGKMDELINSATKYTISFCKKKDLLSQWIAYAKESGVCMEMQFDLDKETEFEMFGYDASEEKDSKRTIPQSGRPKEIIYYTAKSRMPEEHREAARNHILQRIFEGGSINDTSLPKRWNEVSIYVKHYDFYQEEEYRIAFETADFGGARIDYRMDRHILKPYLDVACKDGWPITRIMVGPGFNQELVFSSIKFYLDHETIKSSALVTVEKWKEHLKEYFAEVAKVHGSHIGEESEMETGWIESLEQEDIEEQHQRAGIQKRVVTIMEKVDKEYLDAHYFTVSGIILEKSAIPYIY